MSWWSLIHSVLNAGRPSRQGSSRRWLPSLTFLLTQQYTAFSIAGWVSGFVSTAHDIVSIFKDCREMSRDSESESKNSPNVHDGRRPLTDFQLFGTFVFCVISQNNLTLPYSHFQTEETCPLSQFD